MLSSSARRTASRNIDDVLSYEERTAIVRGYASTAGYAQQQVNKPGKAA